MASNIDSKLPACFQQPRWFCRLPRLSLKSNRLQTSQAVVSSHASLVVNARSGRTSVNGFSLAATFEGEFSDVTRSYAGKGVVDISGNLVFRVWRETVMAVLSPQVRYEEANGPSSVAVRGPSWTQRGHCNGLPLE
jgi:hypothetical protein